MTQFRELWPGDEFSFEEKSPQERCVKIGGFKYEYLLNDVWVESENANKWRKVYPFIRKVKGIRE